jgi:hypothetical protein
MQDDAISLERSQGLGGHVRVVERDDVALPREGTHDLDVGVVAHRGGRDHQCGGGVGRLRKNREGDRQPHRRRLAHPCELAGTDDADDREPSRCALKACHEP